MGMTFGELLQRTRVNAGISLRDLGNAVGLSAVYISDMERNQRRPPNTALVLKIANALNVDPDPLLEAGMGQREAIELGVARDAALQAALALSRVWDSLDEAGYERIRRAALEATRREVTSS